MVPSALRSASALLILLRRASFPLERAIP